MANDFEKPKWQLVNNTYDLQLANPESVDYQNLNNIFEKVIERHSHGRNIAAKFVALFREWLNIPEHPLREEAYVLLSNWFLTKQPGVADSTLGVNAETLWNSLFCCKPNQRLSDPGSHKNHKVLPEQFALWWPRQLECQEKV